MPIHEAATDEIQNLLSFTEQDKILILFHQISRSPRVKLVELKEGSEVVAKRIILNPDLDRPDGSCEDAFHGTAFHNLESIYENGLRKEGEIIKNEKIKTVDGHF